MHSQIVKDSYTVPLKEEEGKEEEEEVFILFGYLWGFVYFRKWINNNIFKGLFCIFVTG